MVAVFFIQKYFAIVRIFTNDYVKAKTQKKECEILRIF